MTENCEEVKEPVKIKLKVFAGYLVLNMKTGKMRVCKQMRNSTTTGSEVVVKFKLNVHAPETQITEITGNITLPEVKMTELLFEELAEK